MFSLNVSKIIERMFTKSGRGVYTKIGAQNPSLVEIGQK
jgi:hypothetical protein